ncbi:MAG: hypothetical protein K2X77_24000 [Candidatus Obscuribacterales bacterium]|jgi:hypothetical protein|nr:hypothetical protein [Candidatus Obscuribacterales bacterium]
MLPNNYSCQKCPDAIKAEVFVKEEGACQISKEVGGLTKAQASQPASRTRETVVESMFTISDAKEARLAIASQNLINSGTNAVLLNSNSPQLTGQLPTQDSFKETKDYLNAVARPSFDSPSIDDRSIQSRITVSPIARTFMALLISFHGLAQVPGVGGAGQSFADFEISNKVVVPHKSGLALTYNRFAPVDSQDRPVYSI